MKLKIFFSSLLLFSLALTIFFGYWSASSLIGYWARSKKSEARILKWEVEKHSEQEYRIKVKYLILPVEGKQYGSYLFPEKFLNKESAIISIKSYKLNSYNVWFNPINPSNSSLESVFPLNLTIRFLLSLIVFLYFLFKISSFNRKFVEYN